MVWNRVWGVLSGLVLLATALTGMDGETDSRTGLTEVARRSAEPGIPSGTSSVPLGRPTEAMVTIYLREDNVRLGGALVRAEETASRIFGGIGVPVAWRGKEKHLSNMEAAVRIEIQLHARAPENIQPGTLAYATPFANSGVRVHVLCDRVLKGASGEFAGSLLGHVIAHEIGHVLEGSNRHSAEGVMKARWDSQDYHRIAVRTLPFDAIDTDLIHAALEKSAARSTGNPWTATNRD